MNPYTRRWHIWVCDDPSCHERHDEHQGEVHDVEVVPLSDAERMREALKQIAGERRPGQTPGTLRLAKEIARAALNPEPK